MSYEIEVKSLLGSKENADELLKKLKEVDPNLELVDENAQLNHYFIDGDMEKLYENTKDLFDKTNQEKLRDIIDTGNSFSIRSREVNGDVRLVLKASVGDDTSANGVSRREFDEKVEGKTLDELDELLLSAGFDYQAKWSRERKEYKCNDMSVCLDKNAGYGYLAEFEKVVPEESMAAQIENEIREFMDIVGAVELPQDRLERMFAHYNSNWPDYYGTDNVFVIE